MENRSKSDAPFTMKVITKRHGKQNPIEEGAGMLRLVRQLRGDALIPKGVYRFKSMEEADRWMTREMARTRLKLKNTIRPGDKMDVDFLKAEIEAERKK